ncbi:MAG: DUF2442 domain-containing protein [Bdellovibrionaceae bacterium]|nr:DUF2442 domain-containing protein [Pseudobdellovibrionaceae bacterium]
MKLQKNGRNISAAEIQSVSEFGIWMLINQIEYFIAFKDFPWFERATVHQIYNFQFVHGRHLYWPELDVDLALESLRSPEKFPLKAK